MYLSLKICIHTTGSHSYLIYTMLVTFKYLLRKYKIYAYNRSDFLINNSLTILLLPPLWACVSIK
jgi:hypothetical protein